MAGGALPADDGGTAGPAEPAGGRVPDVRTFPSADRDFAHRVERLGAAAGWDARRLEDRLRGRYPRVRVVCQEPLAMMEGHQPLLYAYRDGSILAARRPDGR